MSGVVFSRYFLVQNFSQSLMTGVTKSVRFLPSITPFAVVRGTTTRGGCVRRWRAILSGRIMGVSPLAVVPTLCHDGSITDRVYSKFVRFVVLLAVLISLGLGTSCVTSKDTRKKKWVHIGGSWGLHWAYFATPPLRFEIPGETFPFGAEYDSSSGKVLGIGDTFEVSNQGTYVRYFPGNPFNILLGAFSWTFKSDSWSVLNSSWQTVTYKVNNKITDVGIASATSGWATGAAPSGSIG